MGLSSPRQCTSIQIAEDTLSLADVRADYVSQQGIPARDVTKVHRYAVTIGLTLTICDSVASGLNLEVTAHGSYRLRPRQHR